MQKHSPIRLTGGDVVLIPRAARHALSGDPHTPVVPVAVALERMNARVARFKAGRVRDTAVLLCAEIKFGGLDALASALGQSR